MDKIIDTEDNNKSGKLEAKWKEKIDIKYLKDLENTFYIY